MFFSDSVARIALCSSGNVGGEQTPLVHRAPSVQGSSGCLYAKETALSLIRRLPAYAFARLLVRLRMMRRQ